MLNSPPASPPSSWSRLTPLLLLDPSPEPPPRPRPPLLPGVVVETPPASENCLANMRDIVAVVAVLVVEVVEVVAVVLVREVAAVWLSGPSQHHSQRVTETVGGSSQVTPVRPHHHS